VGVILPTSSNPGPGGLPSVPAGRVDCDTLGRVIMLADRLQDQDIEIARTACLAIRQAITDPRAAKVVAADPHTSVDILRELAQHPLFAVVAEVASNPAAPPDALVAIYSRFVRNARPNGYLARDRDGGVPDQDGITCFDIALRLIGNPASPIIVVLTARVLCTLEAGWDLGELQI